MKKKQILKAEYGSDKTPLKFGNNEVPCYVLEDGTRVLSGRAMQRAIGYEGSSGDWLKKFVSSKTIGSYMPPEIVAGLDEPIRFIRNDAGGSQPITYGYEATKLIDLCDALIELKKAGVLKQKQTIYAEQAEMIIRSVAKVGIIALIDEVTGYQDNRQKDALRQFLEKFLREEKGRWVKTFPDEFFESIFKMKGWNWEMAAKGQKPGVMGKYINNYVWARIAPGVLSELKRINPKNELGKRKGKNPQFIDVNFGHPKLKEHLTVLTMFAKASGYNWISWDRMVKRALPKFHSDGSAAQELDFPED